jgi:alcohol dehydrogenase
MAFRISAKSEVLFGDHASYQTGKRAVAFGCKKILCMYDPGVKDAGIIDPIIRNMEMAGLSVIHYGQVQADPPDTIVNECGEFARNEKVDGIVGIGGGSTMDAAKAVNVMLGNPGPIYRYFGLGIKQREGKPLILIPTTAGTASEITHMAVITNTKAGVKGSVMGTATKANLAIVDPQLTRGLPPHITAATGMDTFAHAVEAYTTMETNLMSDTLAERAIDLVTRFLPRAVQNGTDMEARTNMSFACLIAGMAFNDAIVHFGHALGHTLGARHHVPHGIACAIAMPGVIEIAADMIPNRVRRIGEIMGLSLSDPLSPTELARQVSDRIISFSKGIGIPTLKELNIKESDLLPLALGTMSDGCFYFMPKRISSHEVIQIVQKAYAL